MKSVNYKGVFLIAICCVGMLANSVSVASTFVGNGGNAGDIELQVTLAQIDKSMSDIVASGEDSQGLLCRCEDVMKTHKMCESLVSLDQRQIYYCGDTLTSKAKDILALLKSEGGVQVDWTTDLIRVNEKDGSRDADAVAQPLKNKIYLNRDQFLSLKDYERIYLLTHELGHLVKIDKQYIRDDQQVGPFKQEDGGRKLLNSMAAAVAMKSIVNGQVGRYSESLSRSKNYKSNWLSFSLGQQNQSADQSTKFTPYSIEKYSGYNLAYRYQMTQAQGASVGLKALSGSAEIFKKTKATTEQNLVSLSYNLRLFPFDDPMSTWGQSHFILGIGYEAGTVKMKLSDDRSDISEKVQTGSPLASIQYYLPFDSGIWFHAGLALTAHKYEFAEIGYRTQDIQSSTSLGVTYGF